MKTVIQDKMVHQANLVRMVGQEVLEGMEALEARVEMLETSPKIWKTFPFM